MIESLFERKKSTVSKVQFVKTIWRLLGGGMKEGSIMRQITQVFHCIRFDLLDSHLVGLTCLQK